MRRLCQPLTMTKHNDAPPIPIQAMAGDPMPARRRELYFRVIDTYQDIHAITHRLHFLDNHFPPNKLDQALAWLVLNGTVGAKFIRWFKEECKSSDLEMHRMLLSVIDNVALQPVIAGRNFKT